VTIAAKRVAVAPSNTGTRRSRRQALKVFAAALALPAAILALRGVSAGYAVETWHGESMGGLANLTLWHPRAEFARHTIVRLRAEIERLETVFSLYEPNSEISRLNREGTIAVPSTDLVAVLDEAQGIADVSGGAFDPTVQPLWMLYESHFRDRADLVSGPSQRQIDATLTLVDYTALDASHRRISFSRPGMKATLNGIAQGYITDRIADLLRQEGFDHAMVEVGETRALGEAIDGRPFSIGLRDPSSPGTVNRTIDIADEALSVSGGYGTRFGASSSHHIFQPATGLSANSLLDATVIAPRAVWADALSTAIYVAGESAAPALLAAYPNARAFVTRPDGSVLALGVDGHEVANGASEAETTV
jgi:thiamine biosynthesis lipoprotein